jgi:hypothetical protein
MILALQCTMSGKEPGREERYRYSWISWPNVKEYEGPIELRRFSSTDNDLLRAGEKDASD